VLPLVLEFECRQKMTDKFETDFQTTIREALREWVQSLPVSDRTSNCICLSSVAYSPLEILEAVERGTELGKELMAGLSALQCRMVARDPHASVADLIQRSFPLRVAGV
jgi:hypothetical protein